jgi:hypothetical protein
MSAIEVSKRSKYISCSSKSPWMTNALLVSCNHKHVMFKQVIKGTITRAEYNNYRNQLTKLIRERKKQFYLDICAQNVKNTKVVWEHLNQLIGRKAKENNLPSTLNSNEINNFFYKSGFINC